ncbi:MAG TPA: hypothetical protein VM260_22660 [Pirellula sp.]|nr:hypothetical protein [Pirellula sp.]
MTSSFRSLMHSNSECFACFVVLSLFIVSGCSGPADDTIPVWGKITFNGIPLATGDIEFSSKQVGGLRRGAMITKGDYRTAPMQGLIPGEYVVRIFSIAGGASGPSANSMPGDDDALGPAASRDLIPAKYNMRSNVLVKVTAEGPNEFNFDIPAK